MTFLFYFKVSDEWVQDCELLLVSVQDQEGIKAIINDLLQQIVNTDKHAIKIAALDMLNWFCSKTKADYTPFADDLIKNLLNLFAEKNNENILQRAWTCLNSVIGTLSGIQLMHRLSVIRQTLRLLTQFYYTNQTQRYYELTMCDHDNKKVLTTQYLLPGFCLPKKGIACFLPVFKEGLLNGAPDVKEASALTLCECIKLADGDSLKTSVMAITGPLIRVLGERYNWTIKSAILDAIYFLLLKVDITLKPFLPQLQPTFMKNLSDSNKIVRIKSGAALAKLLLMNPRLDQILLDIQNLLKTASSSDNQQTKETLVNTLRLCFNNVGHKLQDETKQQLLTLLNSDQFLYSEEYTLRAVSAGALGSLVQHLSESSMNSLLADNVLNYEKSVSKKGWTSVHGNCMLVQSALRHSPSLLLNNKQIEAKLVKFVQSCAQNDRAPVVLSSLRSICYYLDYVIKNLVKAQDSNELPQTLAKCINNQSGEIKELSVHVLIYLSVLNEDRAIDDSLLRVFVPMLVNGTREKAPSVRFSSEVALVKILRLKHEQNNYEVSFQVIRSFLPRLHL